MVEGVDLALFDEEGRITTLVQFDMQVGCVFGCAGLPRLATRSACLSDARCSCLLPPCFSTQQDYSRLLRSNAPAPAAAADE